MKTIELIDHLGDYWSLMLPCVYERQRNGLVVMWVYVARGPEKLTRWYQQIPLPIFTEWWE